MASFNVLPLVFFIKQPDLLLFIGLLRCMPAVLITGGQLFTCHSLNFMQNCIIFKRLFVLMPQIHRLLVSILEP